MYSRGIRSYAELFEGMMEIRERYLDVRKRYAGPRQATVAGSERRRFVETHSKYGNNFFVDFSGWSIWEPGPTSWRGWHLSGKRCGSAGNSGHIESGRNCSFEAIGMYNICQVAAFATFAEIAIHLAVRRAYRM